MIDCNEVWEDLWRDWKGPKDDPELSRRHFDHMVYPEREDLEAVVADLREKLAAAPKNWTLFWWLQKTFGTSAPPLKPAVRPAPVALSTATAPPRPDVNSAANAAFDVIWAEKPVRASHAPQSYSTTKQSWDNVVRKYGLDVVVKACRTFILVHSSREHPQNLVTFLESGEIEDWAAHANLMPTEKEQLEFEYCYRVYPDFVGKEVQELMQTRLDHYLAVVRPEDRLAFRVSCEVYGRQVKREGTEKKYVRSWSSHVADGWLKIETKKQLGRILNPPKQAPEGGFEAAPAVPTPPDVLEFWAKQKRTAEERRARAKRAAQEAAAAPPPKPTIHPSQIRAAEALAELEALED